MHKNETDKKVKINPAFVSPCGLYCGVCAIHIADRDDNEKLKIKLLALYKGKTPGKGTLPNSEQLTTKDIRCKGCLSDDRFMHCKQCAIRDCTQENKLEGCHQCDEFPCALIDNFSMTVGKKVIMRAVPERRTMSTGDWVQREEKRYHCPECGNKVFRGVIICNQCKTPLDLD